jgi:hypothetical protein
MAMLDFVKMSALSAVLSFGVVATYNGSNPGREEASTGKVYLDRVLPDADPLTTASVQTEQTFAPGGEVLHVSGRKGDRLTGAAARPCADQQYPHIASGCVSQNDSRAKPAHVRMITVETRPGANLSVLERVPQAALAHR